MDKLIMPFTNEHLNFAYGFQCGQVFERLNHADEIEGLFIHAECIPDIDRICRLFHSIYTIDRINEDWAVLNAKIDLSKAN